MVHSDFYKEFPKTCAPDNFWGQVKRTVNGKPVDQSQIDMIVNAVTGKLRLAPDDFLLDLCCGNGALSTLLFCKCNKGFGVDFSEYLIQVAKENFESPDQEYHLVDDVTDYVFSEQNPKRFTKAMCYGSFQYLEADAACRMLGGLRDRFTNLERFFIGNVPDKDQIMEFYSTDKYIPGIENDHCSSIGVWRCKAEFGHLAAITGWKAEFRSMPEQYYAANYRYDVILTPKNA